MIIDSQTLKGDLDVSELATPPTDPVRLYTISKTGNWLLAAEFANRYGKGGITSLAQNPGQLGTKIWDGSPKIARKLFAPFNKPAIMGAYTALWTGLSEVITAEDGGGTLFLLGAGILPRGRIL
jgi:hypothetical protein